MEFDIQNASSSFEFLRARGVYVETSREVWREAAFCKLLTQNEFAPVPKFTEPPIPVSTVQVDIAQTNAEAIGPDVIAARTPP